MSIVNTSSPPTVMKAAYNTWHGRGDKLNGDKRVQNVTDRFNQIFVVTMWRALLRTIVIFHLK